MIKLHKKLKALLAAGLLGIALLGMQSCAQPSDDKSSAAETTVEETDEQKWSKTFGKLLTYSEINKEHAKRLANAEVYDDTIHGGVKYFCDTVHGGAEYVENATNYKYIENGFKELTSNEVELGVDYDRYISDEDPVYYVYHIPTSKRAEFKTAIETYKNK